MRVIMMVMIWITVGVRVTNIAHTEIILLGNEVRYSYDFEQTRHGIPLSGSLLGLLRSTQS
jgi:hypothetical protein